MDFCKKCNIELIRGVNWPWSNKLCYPCYNAYKKGLYHKNWEKKRAIIKKYELKHNKTEIRKRQRRDTALRMYKKYPEKFEARYLVQRAVAKGKLVKRPCEVCGSLKVEGHHEDYSRPLEVNWLCKKHHMLVQYRRISLPMCYLNQ